MHETELTVVSRKLQKHPVKQSAGAWLQCLLESASDCIRGGLSCGRISGSCGDCREDSVDPIADVHAWSDAAHPLWIHSFTGMGETKIHAVTNDRNSLEMDVAKALVSVSRTCHRGNIPMFEADGDERSTGILWS